MVLGFPSLYKELSVNKEKVLRAPNRRKPTQQVPRKAGSCRRFWVSTMAKKRTYKVNKGYLANQLSVSAKSLSCLGSRRSFLC